MSSVYQRLDDLQIFSEGSTNAEKLNVDQGLDLNQRLLVRAAELRKSWGYPNVIVRTNTFSDGTDSSSKTTNPIVSKIDISTQSSILIQNRSVSNLPENELRNAVITCMPLAGEIEHNHLLLSAAHLLGYREVSTELRNRLNRVIDTERLAGRLETITGIQRHRRKE